MTPRKINRAFVLAGIPDMRMTRRHILDNVTSAAPADVLSTLTARQLAAVILVANASYHDGRASKGDVELCDGSAVWVGLGVQKLIPLQALAALAESKVSRVEDVEITTISAHSNKRSVSTAKRERHYTRYSLQYDEPRPY